MFKDFFSRVLKFIKQYPAVLYSFLLIVILPLLLYYNTFLILKSFQENIDYSLQTKALTIENILETLLSDFFDNPEVLQQKIEEIAQENPEIKELSILTQKPGGKFIVLVSQNPDEIGIEVQDPSFALSYSQDNALANLRTKENERFWNVMKPIFNKEGSEKIGLINISLSLKDADALVTQTIFRSYIIVLIIILFSLFLILQHTRLFGYVSLSKKLQEIDKMKDDFIRMTTHELRSPIITVVGYIDILEQEIKSLTKKQKESFRRAKISAKNLSDLVEDILEVSRIEQGRLDFAPKIISPSRAIKIIVEELGIKAEQKKLSLDSEVAKGNYYIKVNPKRFRQILVNLIENSIKYTFKGGISITTRVEEIRKRYIIEVKDTGVGISAEAQKRLFERFYRVKTEKTAGVQGTGLGLWITKQLCEKMNGQIFVESMGGMGTKFTVVFPLIEK